MKEKVEHTQTPNALLQILQYFKLYPYSIVSRTIDTDDTYQGFNPIMPVAPKKDVQTIFVISMYHQLIQLKLFQKLMELLIVYRVSS